MEKIKNDGFVKMLLREKYIYGDHPEAKAYNDGIDKAIEIYLAIEAKKRAA